MNRSGLLLQTLAYIAMKSLVLGVPHTQTTRAFNTCPFTIKAWNQCRMLTRLGREVNHIGVEGV